MACDIASIIIFELDDSGKSQYKGKVTIPLMQSSTNCRISCWCDEKYFLLLVNNQAHSWLSIAHAVPSPSPCIEISLAVENKFSREYKFDLNFFLHLPKIF